MRLSFNLLSQMEQQQQKKSTGITFILSLMFTYIVNFTNVLSLGKFELLFSVHLFQSKRLPVVFFNRTDHLVVNSVYLGMF